MEFLIKLRKFIKIKDELESFILYKNYFPVNKENDNINIDHSCYPDKENSESFDLSFYQKLNKNSSNELENKVALIKYITDDAYNEHINSDESLWQDLIESWNIILTRLLITLLNTTSSKTYWTFQNNSINWDLFAQKGLTDALSIVKISAIEADAVLAKISNIEWYYILTQDALTKKEKVDKIIDIIMNHFLDEDYLVNKRIEIMIQMKMNNNPLYSFLPKNNKHELL